MKNYGELLRGLTICYGTSGKSNNVYYELRMIHLRQRSHMLSLAIDYHTNVSSKHGSYTQKYYRKDSNDS